MKIAGWVGVKKPGLSEAFRLAIIRLNKDSTKLAIEDVFKEMAKECGYGAFNATCCPQCGYIVLTINDRMH